MRNLLLLLLLLPLSARAQRTDSLLTRWQFSKPEAPAWRTVRVPHDWAITGPFDKKNDLQTVAVTQNGETRATEKTGRTGGLPFIGKGSYRTTFCLADTAARTAALLFDGAMANAHVRVNGAEVAYWPYGYNAFHADITAHVRPGENTVEVDLENFERASRWYPGAGLFRNVHLITAPRAHVPVWGTYVTTPHVAADTATVRLAIEIAGLAKGEKAVVATDILDPDGRIVATAAHEYVAHGQTFTQNFTVAQPRLWSPATPYLYRARTRVSPAGGAPADEYTTRFGIRSIEYLPERGFLLNGQPTKFRGVCLHHDLGPLGSAVNRSALRHRLAMLRDMGANAIRTSHNMPSPELVALCDEMGIMLMVEPFDDWGIHPKSPNGYGRFFKEWAARDITNMVRHYRNAPSVVMWSIGNEVPSQRSPEGIGELCMLRDLVHSLDATRPVTCGMDQFRFVVANGFAASLDIPGFNYKPQFYTQAHAQLPQGLVLGSETASTVSSRGVYHFPVEFGEHRTRIFPDHQSSSYDDEACPWSNTPDIDFAADADLPWMIGQFVWTGFDYLGEPSPYDTDAWPSHSSVFGIIDLASLPKDRYWLYRSVWNTAAPTLHVLPHWTWPGREGQTTPVFVYTSYPRAELFVNGVSQGVREKAATPCGAKENALQSRFRLMWPDVKYQPGELRVVAYRADGTPAEERTVRTAGRPHHLVLTPARTEMAAGGDELAYFTITVADRDGTPVPADTRTVRVSVRGAGSFEAAANGDPTCLTPFQSREMPLFSGAATAIARAAEAPGTLIMRVEAKGLKAAEAQVNVVGK